MMLPFIFRTIPTAPYANIRAAIIGVDAFIFNLPNRKNAAAVITADKSDVISLFAGTDVFSSIRLWIILACISTPNIWSELFGTEN